MEWNNARPLQSGPGRALAAMMTDWPGQAYTLAAGKLERSGVLAPPPLPDAPVKLVEFALTDYLEGVAAAAIVADAATGGRDWTGAQDYAVNGKAVTFLPPEALLLGTLTLALAAANRIVDLAPQWEAHPQVEVPEGHRSVVGQIQRALAGAAQARMTQMSERAEDANG